MSLRTEMWDFGMQVFRTLRIWSTDDYKEITHCINKQRKVIKTKNAVGKRAIPTTCCYSRDGKYIAAGCDDGSIQIWKHGNLYVSFKHLTETYVHLTYNA